MSPESQLQTWSYLRQQISDNLSFSCPSDAHISVVTSRDPTAKVWHALAVQSRNNCKTVVLTDQGYSVELALKGLFIKSAYHVHRYLSLKKTSTVSPPTPSGRPPVATRQSEGSAYDSSSDDSDWEELKLQAKITRAKKLLNRYKTGQNTTRPVSLPAPPPPPLPSSSLSDSAPRYQSSPPPPPPPPRLPPHPAPRLSAHGTKGLALPSRAAEEAAPPPRFTTHPRVPPLIPPLLPVRLAVRLAINAAANNETAPVNVLTTISRPSLRALLVGAIACVGQQDTSGYRAKARRAHLDGVACDMALFAADDLSFFFGKDTVPFFEVEVWRESITEQPNSDADGDDDEDEA
ncbi:predicted protein [Verticillium alfalfae VaMs.102]|uniref:Predicted protein n=1 Tax=Verticillium alfalfae (strain VaMs.102 / ATCC MYA-4576 / FGSC 10136) TaxID=526221 RepID=C9SPI7_VERA1|nr:predicted protein [Verticillium alfalfae VaMs.102]EEY20702.1 predicted protein [Verticillium alfalfae VaMs.102]